MVCELAGLEPDRLLEWARALQLESGWARQRGMADGGCAISTPRPMMASRQPRIPSSINTQTGVSLSKGADEFIATIFATHRTCAVGQPWKFPRPKNQTVGVKKFSKSMDPGSRCRQRVHPGPSCKYWRCPPRLVGREVIGQREGPPPACSTEKSWPHFRPSAVDFCCCRLAIGAATERARALAMPAGSAPKPYKRDSNGVAPASPQVA